VCNFIFYFDWVYLWNSCLPTPVLFTENSWIGETLFFKERTNQIKLKSRCVQEFNALNQCITSDLILVESLFENSCLAAATSCQSNRVKSWRDAGKTKWIQILILTNYIDIIIFIFKHLVLIIFNTLFSQLLRNHKFGSETCENWINILYF
jgi:uncharacterized membrane protein YhaH (DUF805 family)